MRLGYVGLDNSHADALIPEINVKRPSDLPESRIVCIWGKDAARAAALQEKGQVERVVERAEDMLGAVDGVIVGARHGDRHLPEARAFLEAGLPVYIDKPLALTLADAEEILNIAGQHGSRVTSFSGLRTIREVIELRDAYKAIDDERHGGALNGHGDDVNPYGGWYFYAVHCIELMLEIFSPKQGTLRAEKLGEQLHVRVADDSGQVVTILLSPKYPPFSIAAYGNHKTLTSIVPLNNMQEQVTRRVVAFMHGGADLSRDELLAPLKVIEAVRQSMAEGRAVDYLL